MGRPKKIVADAGASKDSGTAMSDNDKPYKSKVHAVELALEKLGWDAMPAKIRGYLRDNFNLELTTAHIGVNKTNILRRRGIIAGPDGTTSSTPAVLGRPPRTYRRAAERGTERGTFIAVESFDTVRGLLKEFNSDTILKIGEVIDKVGVSQLREIVRLLS